MKFYSKYDGEELDKVIAYVLNLKTNSPEQILDSTVDNKIDLNTLTTTGTWIISHYFNSFDDQRSGNQISIHVYVTDEGIIGQKYEIGDYTVYRVSDGTTWTVWKKQMNGLPYKTVDENESLEVDVPTLAFREYQVPNGKVISRNKPVYLNQQENALAKLLSTTNGTGTLGVYLSNEGYIDVELESSQFNDDNFFIDSIVMEFGNSSSSGECLFPNKVKVSSSIYVGYPHDKESEIVEFSQITKDTIKIKVSKNHFRCVRIQFYADNTIELKKIKIYGKTPN